MSVTNQEWNLGTAPRGLDGDTSREAGVKYNAHKHPPTDLDDEVAFDSWVAADSRLLGDACRYAGIIYIWDGNDPIPVGLGPGNVGQMFVSDIPLAFNTISHVMAPSWEEVGGDSFDPRIFALSRADRTIKFKVTAYLIGVAGDPATVRLVNLTTNTVVTSIEVSNFNAPVTVESAALTSDDGLRNSNDIYAVQVQITDKALKVVKASLVVYSELG